MDCRERSLEIMECARANAEPASGLRMHLRLCESCRARWEAEATLSAAMRQARAAGTGQRSSEFGRARLMAEFGRLHPPARPKLPGWKFLSAAAAVLALALGLSSGVHAPPVAAEDAGEDNGFVAVPYAAPLATGEMVSVIRTQLYAAALDRMGVSVPAGNGQFPADVILGQDGLPRAVRVLSDVNF